MSGKVDILKDFINFNKRKAPVLGTFRLRAWCILASLLNSVRLADPGSGPVSQIASETHAHKDHVET